MVAAVLSFAVGLMRLSRLGPLRVVAGFYVEVIRGTSALVQLFYLFFILPAMGIRLDPFSTAVIGVGVNISAYGSEIVRAAVLNVDRGQWEAAIALDMPRLMALRRIILPQALLAMLPSFGNLLVDLLKLTSLVSLLTLTDLTFAGTALITTTGRPGQVWGLVLILYFCLATPISWLVRRFEAALAARQRGRG
jgi:polar amino acid transport system permease protein